MSGLLVSLFRETGDCEENKHAKIYNHIPYNVCTDGFQVESCEHNIMKAIDYDDDYCTSGNHQFDWHLKPNSREVCFDEEDGDGYTSIKCSNNHMYH